MTNTYQHKDLLVQEIQTGTTVRSVCTCACPCTTPLTYLYNLSSCPVTYLHVSAQVTTVSFLCTHAQINTPAISTTYCGLCSS